MINKQVITNKLNNLLNYIQLYPRIKADFKI